ncbi:MAG TPA: twin-arginine translocase subunit TatC [Thermoanaerobacterales bacterium]|jgi:sec-independent protein translocase protein TatC|nr:twin-arginine translocase subunit TatC [Thermoanaerobacterales bacterium]
MNDEKLPFALHLEELRGRLLICLFVISILSLTSFVIWPKIISLMWINDISMIYISPQEAFLTRIKVSSICGLLGSIPVILHQIWKFIKPALTERERKLIISLGIVSTVLLFAGIYFNVFIVTPIVVNFFLRSSQPTLKPLISISNYASFLMNMTLAFALISQLPLLMMLAAVLGLVNFHSLSKYRKITVIGIFILAAVLTPPDALSQLALALPMWGLYELSLIFIKIIR